MPLTPLRARINELCPELMKLEFGCELKGLQHKDEDGDLVFMMDGIFVGETKNCYQVYFNFFDGNRVDSFKKINFFDKFEILGREPRLADVLRAMKKVGSSMYVRSDGVFFKWEKFTDGGDGHHGVKSTYIVWDLTDDRLSAQPPETLELLSTVLGVK